jgi:ATP-dependent DNA helicase RecQ
LKLARLARSLGVERVLALTATATPPVAADICREFGIAREGFIHTGFYRPNLLLRVTQCRAGERLALLIGRLRDRPRGPTIVYVTLQRTAEKVAAELARNGFGARAYHAGMEHEERDAVQDWFMRSSDAVVVATIAFGMGIDKADIRYVYHYNLPKSLENYSQEIGRAGRDGKESVCEMLACGDDVIVLENFTYGDTPDEASVSAMVDDLLRGTEEFDVSTYELSRTHDVRPLVVTTLLTYLELADVLEATAPFYSEYQFQPLKGSREILARFDAERAAFLRTVFASAVKAQKWFHIDLETTAKGLQTTRDRLVKTFSHLEESGDVTLKVAGLRQGYRIKTRPPGGKPETRNPKSETNPERKSEDISVLKRRLVERFETRERNDVGRVRQVLTLAEHSGCLVRHLLSYFGEELGRDCGHCGNCLGEARKASVLNKDVSPVTMDRANIAALAQKHPDALGTPRQIARFLCGLTSPRLTQRKLSKHPLFGSLAELPFQTVMSAASSLGRSP